MITYPLGIVGPWEIVIIFLIVLLIFGGKKIPELMHALGKGAKSFREGVDEATAEIKEAKKSLDGEEEKKDKIEE